MITILFTTWIGGLILGAWLVGFLLEFERSAFAGKDIPNQIVTVLGWITWPVPVVIRWITSIVKWIKSRKKNNTV